MLLIVNRLRAVVVYDSELQENVSEKLSLLVKQFFILYLF